MTLKMSEGHTLNVENHSRIEKLEVDKTLISIRVTNWSYQVAQSSKYFQERDTAGYYCFED